MRKYTTQGKMQCYRVLKQILKRSADNNINRKEKMLKEMAGTLANI